MSAITIGASLPPQVEGQLRCFLSLKVELLNWSIPQPPKDVQVSVHWWGDNKTGTYLRPIVESDPNYVASDQVSEVHFPIRCGPRQFNSYMQDMGLLHMDVVFGALKTKFAKVDIKDIGNLSSSKPLSGNYPVVCTVPPNKSKQVGNLGISIAFKTLSDTYNVNSAIVPTTDKEFCSTPNKKKKKLAKKKSSAKHVHYSSKSPERIVYSPKIVSNDDDISFVVGPGANRNIHHQKDEETESLKTEEPINIEHSAQVLYEKDSTESNTEIQDEDTKDIRVPISEKAFDLAQKPEPDLAGYHTMKGAAVDNNRGGSNILSLLLEKGEKLRDDMIKSQVDGKSKSSKIDSPCKLPKDSFDRNIENLISKEKRVKNKHIEDAAVDLLIGEEESYKNVLQHLSISSDESIGISELSDALHDSSLLSDLFYNTKAGNEKAEESSIIFTEDDTTLSESQHKKEEGKTKNKFERKQDSISDDTITSISVESAELESTKIEKDDSVGSEFNYKKLLPDTLSVETLTLLGRVKSARVTLQAISLCESRVLGNVYFIEYGFPVTYFDKNIALAIENVCNVSKSVKSKDEILFERISVFPLCFNEETVNFWWNNSIHFKCSMKLTRQQKQILFGVVDFKLRQVLLSDSLAVNATIDILSHDSKDKKKEPIGKIKLLIELVVDHNSHVKSSTLKPHSKTDEPIPVVIRSSQNISQIFKPEISHVTKKSVQVDANEAHTMQIKPTTTHNSLPEKRRVLVMASLLSISEGRGIFMSDGTSQRQQSACHFYCVSRVFWNKENGRTQICWDSHDPLFQFQQIDHVDFTEDSIKKMKSNLMIIEVWSKSTSTNKDKLIGMSKVSLNQYFLSFRDEKYGEKLLKSQYPVISVDDWLPIIDVISGKSRGHLKVIHALGTTDQIMRLLSMKGDQAFPRTRQHSSIHHDKKLSIDRKLTDSVEHTIEITVEKATNVFEACNAGEVWGESDCYVQYHFPVQHSGANESYECFKTKTTLCVPNLIFNHLTKHTFTLHPSIPVHTLFKKGSDAIEEIEFKLWKRQYYPNIREQLIGKCYLPTVKLSAIITMHTEGSVSSQSFTLPLTSLNVSQQEDTSCRGSLNIFVTYKKEMTLTQPAKSRDMVGLSVSIFRICGLKPCVENVLRRGTSINPYVRFYFSSLKESSVRETNAAINTACPTYSHHVEFPIPMVQNHGRVQTIAELLEDSHFVCEVYHKENTVEDSDVLLASGKFPLCSLLSRNNGIRQWIALTGKSKGRGKSVTSGIEVELKFSNTEDRRNIINISRSMGWSPASDIELNNEAWLSPQQSSRLSMGCQVDVLLDTVWVPDIVIEECIPGFKELNRTRLYVYSRYRFYDKAPVITSPCKLKEDKDGGFVAKFKEKKDFEVSPTTSFAWYLHEELLEIQFWISSSGKSTTKPDVNDRLLGSAYISLNKLSHSPFEKHSLSELHPLFKSDSASICDATARVCVSFNDTDGNVREAAISYDEERHQDEESYDKSNEEESLLNDICTQTSRPKLQTQEIQVQASKEEGVDDIIDDSMKRVSLKIEEALHLPRYLSGDEYHDPSTYVTCQLPGQPDLQTNVIDSSIKPEWVFQKELKIDFEKLKGRVIDFTVWRCLGEVANKDKDLQIGVSRVDTSPLFYARKELKHFSRNFQSKLNEILGKKVQLLGERNDLEEDLLMKYKDIVSLKEELYNKSIQLQDLENEVGGYKAMIDDYVESTLQNLERANGKLIDAYSEIEIEIWLKKEKLSNKLEGIRWFNISKKIDVHAIGKQLLHLENAREEIENISDILIGEYEFLDIKLQRMFSKTDFC